MAVEPAAVDAPDVLRHRSRAASLRIAEFIGFAVTPAGPSGQEVDVVDQLQGPDQRVVVGVDNSAGSREALRWAFAYARLTGATVEAIAAWQVPPLYTYAYRWPPTGVDDAGIVRYTERTLSETVAQVLSGEEEPVRVTTRVVEGPAAQILLAAGEGAQLMVLGSRGHGAFAGMLLGSVSQHCVQHATCPTAVIPE